ncbi:MAG TPA: response regulator [Planktothrix sp.]|jgi:DNA-binding NarL/FixJ family response regulator
MTRILIIEDDKDFAAILKECLEEDQDLEVAATIGSEQCALDYFEAGKLVGLDCVLVDLQLPKSEQDAKVSSTAGLRLLEEIRGRQHFYGTVIVLTSSREPSDGQRALAAGCDGYLCKHAPIDDIPRMLDELKVAIRGHVMMVSNEMRHVFFREDISAKEARLMDLLSQGKGWTEIAHDLGYKTAKAAANIGDRIFDKLLTMDDKQTLEERGQKKRFRAVEIWKSRHATAAG